jgi:hypothetical protein
MNHDSDTSGTAAGGPPSASHLDQLTTTISGVSQSRTTHSFPSHSQPFPYHSHCAAQALALSLPHLLALDIGRLTLGPAEMVLMQQAGGGGVLPQNLLPADAYALLAPAGAPVPGSQGSEW